MLSSVKVGISRLFDSDWVGLVDDMKSTSGYYFSIGSRRCSWCSKKHDIVAWSTVEVEFIAKIVAISQALWLRKILLDLDLEQQGRTKALVDDRQP